MCAHLSDSSSRPLHISLVGPPNAGKSSLFNCLSSTQVATVNYPGSTVEYHKSSLNTRFDLKAEISDTPGITTLHPNSPDQQVTIDYLFNESSRPDLILVLADATQLGRHLYLARQLKSAGFELIVCITMVDLLEKKGGSIDLAKLHQETGLTCMTVNGRNGDGVRELMNTLKAFEGGTGATPVRPEPCSDEMIREHFSELEKTEAACLSYDSTKAEKVFDWDSLLLHPCWGIVIFIGVMVGVFTSIYWLATPAMDAVDAAFGWLIEMTTTILPDGWFADMMAEGVVAGIGSVVIFLPQIIILFLAISFLEDSGYLARGALLIDRPLSAIGLNGRSFVPLLSGFACAIPAMMAARTMTSRTERLLTIMVIPLMSCSARLPVYLLLIGFITPADKPWIGGLALSALYFLGIISGTIVATILSKMPTFRHRRGGFQLELPAIRRPVPKVILRTTFSRSMNYLKKAGPIIILIGIGLWLITHLPIQSSEEIEAGEEYVAVSKSYAASIGRIIEPVMKPMGLDYRAGVAMTMGFAAREVFVSAMALMYRFDVDDEEEEEAVRAELISRMKEVTFEGTDQKIFTISSCFGLMFFFAFALQCFPTVVVAKNEIGSWKLPLVQLFGYTGIAYLGAVLIVQGMRLIGFA